MSSRTFICHPRQLADALANAVVIGNGTGRKLPAENSCPHVYLTYQGSEDGHSGVVAVYGAGRHSAGRTIIRLDSPPPATAGTVALSAENAQSLQSVLRSAPCGLTIEAAVTIHDEPVEALTEDEDGNPDVIWVNLVIVKNGETLAELGDSDPEGAWDWIMDLVDGSIESAGDAATRPLAFGMDALKRIANISSDGGIVDLSTTAHDGVTAFAIGSQFRGILGNIDRELYAVGGKHGDGPGLPDHLVA